MEQIKLCLKRSHGAVREDIAHATSTTRAGVAGVEVEIIPFFADNLLNTGPLRHKCTRWQTIEEDMRDTCARLRTG